MARAVKNTFSESGTRLPSRVRIPRVKAISVATGTPQPDDRNWGADEKQIGGFLAKQIPAKNGYEFYALLRHESETSAGPKRKKAKKKVKKKAKTATKKKKTTTRKKVKKKTVKKRKTTRRKKA